MEKMPQVKKENDQLLPAQPILAAASVYRSPFAQLKLAAIAISLNIRLRSADMPANMQERAFRYTKSLVDAAPNSRPNPTHIARALKKEFDSSYGLAWHCVVGTSFGSFVTHSPGGFVYFSHGSLSILLFKTEVRPVMEMAPPH
ncbi:PREDICTED: dynein light chain 1, cytoplasmic-like [Nelumbo nucifera]|uniref:Dynein light chain n=2 Tax=Nelumbo nucifera TaxID=4432 RepID=A0A1U8AWC4_NELNU|nr:PREDICTED: dynein light chain 1, cytoplasmic-like [Nelumbo nucifera]DAD20934.1 TPA_asm: hypothetical protein HUJ06_022397 [Nelumbo nucifera]